MSHESFIPVVGNPQSPSAQNREGVCVTTAAGSGLFREGVVLSDAEDPNGRAPVSSTLGLSVNVVSSVPQPMGPLTISTLPNVTIAAMPGVAITSFTVPIGITSHPASGITSFSVPIGVSSLPGVAITSFALPLGVTSLPGIAITSFTVPIGISSHPAVGITTFTPAIGVTSIPGVSVTSHPAPVGISSIPGVAITSYTAATTISTVAIPATGGGLTRYSAVSLATTNSTVVKNAAGQIYGWSCGTSSAAGCYVKLIDSPTAVQVSSAVKQIRIRVPASGNVDYSILQGISFSTGIYVFAVAGAADADNTAITANTALINLFYK